MTSRVGGIEDDNCSPASCSFSLIVPVARVTIIVSLALHDTNSIGLDGYSVAAQTRPGVDPKAVATLITVPSVWHVRTPPFGEFTMGED
jgi:hypothetical protein